MVPWGKAFIFWSPLGSLKFWDFLSFLFILKLSYSKPFHNTLNYASTANIEEVMKFYNLGHKPFETDFRLLSNLHLFVYKITQIEFFSILLKSLKTIHSLRIHSKNVIYCLKIEKHHGCQLFHICCNLKI